MSDCCMKHTANLSAGSCSQCGDGYCDECLVFPFGERRPPMCIACALTFSGVRHRGDAATAARKPVRTRRFGRRKEVVYEVAVHEEEQFDPTKPIFDYS